MAENENEYEYFIDWSALSKNPNAIYILKKNLDKLYRRRRRVSKNPNASHTLKQNLDKVDLEPAIEPKYDYETLRNLFLETYAMELIQEQFHPSNIKKFEGRGFDDPFDEE
jgi:hypothetical protein